MRLQGNKKIFVLYYMLGFLCGIIYANIVAKAVIMDVGVFGTAFLEQGKSMTTGDIDYLLYLFKIRVTMLGALVVLGSTRFRKIVCGGFLLWTGLLCGMVMSAAVLKMRIKGIILCLGALFPHFLFYVPAFLIILWYLYNYPTGKWNLSKTICTGFLLLVGFVVEYSINPVVIQGLLSVL